MAKVTDRGSHPKDSPLFRGGWIIGGRRLTDVIEERIREKAAESHQAPDADVTTREDQQKAKDGTRKMTRQRGEESMPLCAQPEDYGIEIEDGDPFSPSRRGVSMRMSRSRAGARTIPR